MADAAERALVSRATAYRYFPTQESLLLDAVQIEPLIAPVDALAAGFSTDDAAQQLTDLIDTLMPILLSDEAMLRTTERIYMDIWLENQKHGQQMPVRAGRRVRWVESALRPIQGQLDEPSWKRLRSALTLTMGTESIIAMKDVASVEDKDEIVATLRWAAGALLRAALDEATAPS